MQTGIFYNPLLRVLGKSLLHIYMSCIRFRRECRRCEYWLFANCKWPINLPVCHCNCDYNYQV